MCISAEVGNDGPVKTSLINVIIDGKSWHCVRFYEGEINFLLHENISARCRIKINVLKGEILLSYRKEFLM